MDLYLSLHLYMLHKHQPVSKSKHKRLLVLYIYSYHRMYIVNFTLYTARKQWWQLQNIKTCYVRLLFPARTYTMSTLIHSQDRRAWRMARMAYCALLVCWGSWAFEVIVKLYIKIRIRPQRFQNTGLYPVDCIKASRFINCPLAYIDSATVSRRPFRRADTLLVSLTDFSVKITRILIQFINSFSE